MIPAASPPLSSVEPCQRVHVIDTHTGGEPTRVVIYGGPPLASGSLTEQRTQFASEYDWFRSALIDEPRGAPVWVGALICPPQDPRCCCGVIFFNNVGYLGMCGHGTIGVVAALEYLSWIQVGRHRLETPVGAVTIELHTDGRVTIENVPSYRWRAGVEVDVPAWGKIRGDIAWGGNWFFLVEEHGLPLVPAEVDRLTQFTTAVQKALEGAGIRGADEAIIDHIELTAPLATASPSEPKQAKNFVLCPGGAWDRSPCGTGTSAKVACLASDGKLQEGEIWRQQSLIGSQFEASYRPGPRLGDVVTVIPSITGRAWIMADTHLLLDPTDPFRFGIPQ